MNDDLFRPITIGEVKLANRIVMAPMTRSRARPDGVPGDFTATYYSQRASAGLIVSEAVNISPDAIGSPLTPGLFTDAQVEGWRRVTDAVHAAGGRIFAQLWHTGRVGHSSVRGGALPVAPSAIPITGQQHFTGAGMMDYETPRALSLDEVRSTIEDFGHAAGRARDAGFDGVELHAAFGYLPNQFLVESANQRTDEYGGSIETRCRFVIEAMHVLADVWGARRVGIKLSPVIPFNSIVDSDPTALFTHLITELGALELAYIHLMNPLFPLDAFPSWPRDIVHTFGGLTDAPVIANGGYTAETARDEIQSGRAQLVSFGNLFVANPDLPERFRLGGPLATADQATMYGGGEAGYTDYPALVPSKVDSE